MTHPPSTYPIKGILYFFSNWVLVRRIIWILFLTVLFVLVIVGLTFGFLLTLQAHGLIKAGCPVWLAWVVASIFCLIESVIFTIIFYLIATPFWQDALFDDVLKLRGLGYVLKQQRNISETTLCFRGIGTGMLLALFQVYVLIITQVITLIVTMPLHALPVVGTFIYCYLNAWVMTWGHQLHYHLEIKELNVNQSRKLAWKNRDDYILFGMVAVALELIPIANFLFFWTNVVGAALWTADVLIEERRDELNRSIGFTAPFLEEAVVIPYQAMPNVDNYSNNNYGATL
ncbi:5026_t:CDS:2 [Acaulospora morrowiae]|uniref:5026_t:CDS:1 n=1 Tax=Acaulospora morrowiae TaxID=94023 RepID=A0A9N9E1J9_9GLOM|nr:5026_t:CDS:2 [Acaulospora morrowiae]